MNPFWFKAVLLLSVLGRIAKSKQRKDMNSSGSPSRTLTFSIFSSFGAMPNHTPPRPSASVSSPDIFLGNRHIDLRKCWSDKTFQAICRYQHNRSFCRAAGVRCHFRKRLNFFSYPLPHKNSHGCWLHALGACMPAFKICIIFSFSTGLSSYFLTLIL